MGSVWLLPFDCDRRKAAGSPPSPLSVQSQLDNQQSGYDGAENEHGKSCSAASKPCASPGKNKRTHSAKDHDR